MPPMSASNWFSTIISCIPIYYRFVEINSKIFLVYLIQIYLITLWSEQLKKHMKIRLQTRSKPLSCVVWNLITINQNKYWNNKYWNSNMFYMFQLLQGKSIPKLGTLDQIETGSGDGYSGECDDEDGCWGSGNGAAKRRRIVTICEYQSWMDVW